MTRVFVYEFTCAAPAESTDSAGASSLRAEGEAMLAAVLEDFQHVPGVDAFTVREAQDEETAFREAARRADWSLIIAPEFHDVLLTRCRWVLEVGAKLLGPSPEAVELCGDKLALYRHWDRHGVRTPETRPADESIVETWPGPTVRKPRFGAGSQDTYMLAASPPLNPPLPPPRRGGKGGGERREPDRPARSAVGAFIEQPYIAGLPASIAFLIGSKQTIAMPPAEQRLSYDGRFRYLGGRVPLPPELVGRAIRIARQAIDCVPGLFGYVGVDLVLGNDGRDWAIEINPRLTTSYVGLRQLAETNLAEAMLRLAEGIEPPIIKWKSGIIEF
jgi:predicted ATP-grasp superfamily ATP-dependent carboligase